MSEVLKILQTNGVFFLATTDGTAGRVRPFGLAGMFNERLYLFTGKNKEVYKQLVSHPDCEICSCSPTGQWLRVRGKAVFDENREIKKKVFEANPYLLNIYKQGADDPNAAAFYLENPEAVLSDMSGGFQKINI
ncbi:MAG: pyridoxamine 5'-phosphate oxidase family protein [Ignavibacteriales bacterium]